MLYPSQQKIVNRLNHAYRQRQPLTENHYFISGEMGVGKTYMGAQLALDHAQHGVIIIVPEVVSQKWVNVLSELTNPTNLTLVDNQFCQTSQLNLNAGHITVIPNQYFNRLFKDDQLKAVIDQYQKYQSQTSQSKTVWQQLKRWASQQTDINYQRSVNYFQYQMTAPFLIYDEIHQAQKSKLDCLKRLLDPNPAFQREFKKLLPPFHDALFLTGTIFNVDTDNLTHLIQITNPQLIHHQSGLLNETVKNIAMFLNNFWQYISVSLSLKQVQLDTHDKINQTILPIEAIPLAPVETAFYNLVLAQLKANTTTNTKVSQQKHQLLASNLLDFPERQPELEIKKAKRQNQYLKYDQTVQLAVPLAQLKLTQTKKYQRLIANLNQLPAQSTVIYATDYQLIDQLVTALNQTGFTTTQLNRQLRPSQYSDDINQKLQQFQIVIVNPHDVTVGVDIHAQLLIWYQLLTDMSAIIQAQRRVYRLSSTKDSKVLFLPYQLTYQEQLVDAISKSAKNNAASYGVQDRSELAKKTHILLQSLIHTK